MAVCYGGLCAPVWQPSLSLYMGGIHVQLIPSQVLLIFGVKLLIVSSSISIFFCLSWYCAVFVFLTFLLYYRIVLCVFQEVRFLLVIRSFKDVDIGDLIVHLDQIVVRMG